MEESLREIVNQNNQIISLLSSINDNLDLIEDYSTMSQVINEISWIKEGSSAGMILKAIESLQSAVEEIGK